MEINFIFCGTAIDSNNKPRIWGIFNKFQSEKEDYYCPNTYILWGTFDSVIIKPYTYSFKHSMNRRITDKKRSYRKIEGNIFSIYPELKNKIEEYLMIEKLKI
jgi:RNAse (barnase) inhibitor barstar